MKLLFIFLFPIVSFADSDLMSFPGRGSSVIQDYQVRNDGKVILGESSKMPTPGLEMAYGDSYSYKSYSIQNPQKNSSLFVQLDKKSNRVIKMSEVSNGQQVVVNYDDHQKPTDIIFCNEKDKKCLVLDKLFCDKALAASGKKTWFDFSQEIEKCSQFNKKVFDGIEGDPAIQLKMKSLVRTRIVEKYSNRKYSQDPIAQAAIEQADYQEPLIKWGKSDFVQYSWSLNLSRFESEDQLATNCYQIQ